MGYVSEDLPGLDHRDKNLTVLQMVRNRLIWVRNTPGNDEIISNFTYEAMVELEKCFNIRFDKNNGNKEDWSRVGQEQLYHALMRSIIADIVCIYILTMLITSLSTGDQGTEDGTIVVPIPEELYMRRAQAGSVSVEYAQFTGSIIGGGKASPSAFKLAAEKLLEEYKWAATRKAKQLGCILNLIEQTVSEIIADMTKVKPFIVQKWSKFDLGMRTSDEFDIKDFQ